MISIEKEFLSYIDERRKRLLEWITSSIPFLLLPGYSCSHEYKLNIYSFLWLIPP
jgi:hypothetical protein